MTRRTAAAPRTPRSWLGAVAATALLPALLAGCGDDGPGSAPDPRGDRAPDPARVVTPAPLVESTPDPTVELPGPSISPNTAGGPAEGGETSGDAQGQDGEEEDTGTNG